MVLDIFQGKTTVAEVSTKADAQPSDVEKLVDECRRGMENALRARPKGLAGQSERESRTCKRRTARVCCS